MTEVRLHVFLSRAGIASRRRAERYIKEGRVTVNGEVVQALGTRVRPGEDAVAFDGQEVKERQPKATLLLHKPVEVVTTLSDPEGRETVADLITAEPYRFLPVGRLDYHTEGLLLMTTDGELTNRLLHPRYHVPKVYHVRVRGRPSREALGKLREGVELEDGRTQPAVTEVLEEADRHTWLEIVVSEGRNRLVRRMCEQIGHPAQRVVRTELATLPLGEIKPGQYRYLNPEELATLYKVAQLGDAPKLSPRAEQVQKLWLGEPRRGRGRRPGEAHRAPAQPEKKPAREARGAEGDRRDRGDGEARRARFGRDGGRSERDRRDGRFDRADRGDRRAESDRRGGRSDRGQDRRSRGRFDREDRRFDRQDRGEGRRFDREDRRFDRQDRGEGRRFDREDRRFDRQDRGEGRRFDGDRRGGRFDRQDRGEGRRFEGDRRGGRSDRQDRGEGRRFEGDRRSGPRSDRGGDRQGTRGARDRAPDRRDRQDGARFDRQGDRGRAQGQGAEARRGRGFEDRSQDRGGRFNARPRGDGQTGRGRGPRSSDSGRAPRTTLRPRDPTRPRGPRR